MSQTLQITNFSELNIKERSVLDADAAVGATSVTAAYNDNMANNDYLYLGQLGTESGEVATISSLTGAKTIGTSALTKAHNRFEPATVLFGNQLKIYRAANVDGTTPADGSFSVLTTVAIDFDQVQTKYTDSSGGSGYWYKTTYFNSTTSVETSLADCVARRGGSTSVYASNESIRSEAGFKNNQFIPDSLVDEKRRAAQDYIDGQLSGLYTVPFVAPINDGIAEICRQLAAGLLMNHDYGVNASGKGAGDGKIKWAYDEIAKIKNKVTVVTDQNGSDTSIANVGGWSSWPDTTTATADASVGGGERKLRVSTRY